MFKKFYISLFTIALLFTAHSGFAATPQQHESVPQKYITHNGKVNINTIDEKDLVNVKGIGKKRAAAIVAYRKEVGPFGNVQDLLNVRGIGPKLLERIRGELAVS